MIPFQPGKQVLIKFNPYNPELPVTRGQVLAVRADGLIDIAYEPDGEIAPFQPELLTKLEGLSEQQRSELYVQFQHYSQVYAQAAAAVENGGELGIIRQALQGMCDSVWKNQDGSYTAEGVVLMSMFRFKLQVAKHLRSAKLQVHDARVVLDKSRPFSRGSIYQITFRTGAVTQNFTGIRPT
jgi:hypothetical protein